jgi:hypothetical protein
VTLHNGDISLWYIVTHLDIVIKIYTTRFQTCTWIDRKTGTACMHEDMHARAPLIACEDIFYWQGEFHTHIHSRTHSQTHPLSLSHNKIYLGKFLCPWLGWVLDPEDKSSLVSGKLKNNMKYCATSLHHQDFSTLTNE